MMNKAEATVTWDAGSKDHPMSLVLLLPHLGPAERTPSCYITTSLLPTCTVLRANLLPVYKPHSRWLL